MEANVRNSKDNSHKIKKVTALGEPGRAGEGRGNVKMAETVMFPNYSKVKVFKTVFFFTILNSICPHQRFFS